MNLQEKVNRLLGYPILEAELPEYILKDFRARYGRSLDASEFYTLSQIAKICAVPSKDIVALIRKLDIKHHHIVRGTSNNKRYTTDAVIKIYDAVVSAE
jgi:hypothetical protein